MASAAGIRRTTRAGEVLVTEYRVVSDMEDEFDASYKPTMGKRVMWNDLTIASGMVDLRSYVVQHGFDIKDTSKAGLFIKIQTHRDQIISLRAHARASATKTLVMEERARTAEAEVTRLRARLARVALADRDEGEEEDDEEEDD